MSAKQSNKEVTLDKIYNSYLDTKNKLDSNTNAELEIKFGTRDISKITKNTFDRVIKYLLSNGFEFNESSKYYLSIKADDIRVEIVDINNIQEYCKRNLLPTEYPQLGINFNKKELIKFDDGKFAKFNYDAFNFRLTYSHEIILSPESEEVNSLIKNWPNLNKFNRLICRYTMTNPKFPFKIDLSIVREVQHTKSISETNLFRSNPKYEIEIEVLNNRIGNITAPELDILLKKVSKIILSGLQSTNYPISYIDIKNISKDYLKLISSKNTEFSPSDFIGPSSVTLQAVNIAPENKDSNIPNIRNNYTVTDKADGERKLLYIDNTGKIYLITTLATIEFTGASTKNKDLLNTLLDGEHIIHNKLGSFINLYAAFDVYFINEKDIRSLEFTNNKSLPNKTRWDILDNIIKSLAPNKSGTDKLSPIRIEMKKFYDTTDTQSLFTACNLIQQQIIDNQYEYETDGFIFTPKNLGVGMNSFNNKPKSYKHTWEESFKWKPAEFNTIDFLITTKKIANGNEFIGNKFEDGMNTSALNQVVEYKTIILRVGYDIKKHGYINPCQSIIDDEIPIKSSVDLQDRFRPVQFVPSNPYDANAGICNIELKLDSMNEKQMFTESNEVIEDNTIVEFRYDINRPKGWRWIPLRVRYDKTAEYRSGYKNYGNAYHVAQNNWHSIHNPITIEMITTGNNIPNELGQDDIYYNEVKGPKKTKALRDFHNLYVKSKLINSTSNPGDTLIDYAVGKGGDLPKWTHAKLQFVFGIDVSKDNIRNTIDGVCARYLNYKQKFLEIPDGLFVYGDAGKNIKNLNAIYSETGKQITQAIFGNGIKDEKLLGKGVIKSFGKGKDGFNISSMQFALHYMFENAEILHNFFTNVSECTKIGGYFIGTCFNGSSIFNLLKSQSYDGSYTFLDREKNTILKITKKYSHETFNNNLSSLGYAIEVFQSSINKTFREYLVNFEYLTSILENYGFVPLTISELEAIGLSNSIGSFEQLFKLMQTDIKKKSSIKDEIGNAFMMTREEKDVSFLNNYFIFKKVQNIDPATIKIGLVKKTEEEQLEVLKDSLRAQEAVEEVSKKINTAEKEAESSTSIPLATTEASTTKGKTIKTKGKITIRKA